jgi:hypothetical protein
MGLPSPTAQHVAAVGPAAEGGSIALADTAAGFLPGIRYQSVSGLEDRLGAGDPPITPDATALGPVARTDAALPAPGGAEGPSGRDGADAQALARADWLVRLAAQWGDALAPAARDESVVLATAAAPAALATHPNLPTTLPSDPAGSTSGNPWQSVAYADLGAPASLVVAVACSYRLRRPFRKWWRRQGQAAPSVQQLPCFLGRGPHCEPFRATAPRRSRKVCVST